MRRVALFVCLQIFFNVLLERRQLSHISLLWEIPLYTPEKMRLKKTNTVLVVDSLDPRIGHEHPRDHWAML